MRPIVGRHCTGRLRIAVPCRRVNAASAALFAGLVDDAAMFPPGNASAEVALAEHLRYPAAPGSPTWSGRCWSRPRAFDAFVEAHARGRVARRRDRPDRYDEPPGRRPAGVTVVGFEAPVADTPLPSIPDGTVPGRRDRAWARLVSGSCVRSPTCAGRRPRGRRQVPHRRHHGDAFPSEDVLAGVIVRCERRTGAAQADRGTAPRRALHRPRHRLRAPRVPQRHRRGRARAWPAPTEQSVVDALGQRDAAPLVDASSRASTPTRSSACASRFVSFGCCGVEDPINDLVGARTA